VREETFARQKAAGIIPADAKLTERSAGIPAWDSLSADQKKLFARKASRSSTTTLLALPTTTLPARTSSRRARTPYFKYDGGGLGKGGTGTIQVDGKTVATGRIERTLAFRISLDETLDCGEDTGTPVVEDYRTPFKFTGELKKAVITLGLSAADEKKIEEARKLAGMQE